MKQKDDLLWLFDIGLILKTINGGIEVLGGLLVLIIPPMSIVRLVEFVTGGEVANDSGDYVTEYIRSAAHAFAVHTHYFIAVYLILHGALKIILVIGILQGKRMAYLLFIITLGIFGTYEMYRGTALHEPLLQILSALDIMLLVLTAYEYKKRYPRFDHSVIG